MTIGIDDYSYASCTVAPLMPAINVFTLSSLVADADGIGVTSETLVADIDIVTARGEIADRLSPMRCCDCH